MFEDQAKSPAESAVSIMMEFNALVQPTPIETIQLSLKCKAEIARMHTTVRGRWRAFGCNFAQQLPASDNNSCKSHRVHGTTYPNLTKCWVRAVRWELVVNIIS